MKLINNRFRLLSCLPACLVLLCLDMIGAHHTKAAPVAQNPASPGGTNPAARNEQESDVLAGDPRLDVKVSIHEKDARVDDILVALSDLGHVRMDVADMPDIHLSCAFHQTSLRTILRSLADAHEWEWERQDYYRGAHNVLVMRLKHQTHSLDALRPHTQAEADLQKNGEAFLSAASQQSPQLQQAFATNLADMTQLGPEGAGYEDLPPSMQHSLQEMLSAQEQILQAQGNNFNAITPADLNGSRIEIQANTQGVATFYTVTIGNDKGSVGMTITDFADPRDQDHGIVPADQVDMHSEELRLDAQSQQKSSQQDKWLMQKVTLTMSGATLADALQKLSQVAHFDFALSSVEWQSNTKQSFSFVNQPVSLILDKLAAQWGAVKPETVKYSWREDGKALVFHYFLLPSRPVSA